MTILKLQTLGKLLLSKYGTIKSHALEILKELKEQQKQKDCSHDYFQINSHWLSCRKCHKPRRHKAKNI